MSGLVADLIAVKSRLGAVESLHGVLSIAYVDAVSAYAVAVKTVHSAIVCEALIAMDRYSLNETAARSVRVAQSVMAKYGC